MEGVIFNMANKRVFKFATASAVAASALVAAVPASAASVTYEQASAQVDKARAAANGLHAEYTRNADYKTVVDSKEARDELARAKAKIAALKSAKEKAYLNTRIQGTIDTVDRANKYNNAVRVAVTYLPEAKAALEAALVNVDTNVAAAETAKEKYDAYVKQAEINFGKVYGAAIQAKFKSDYLTEAVYNLQKDAAAKIADAKLGPAVKSVSAINAKEIVVKFTQAVDATDAKIATNYVLGDGTITFTPAVSEDGKTVTLTASAKLDVANTKFTVKGIKTKANATVKTAEYNTLLTYADTTAPSVASVEAKGSSAVITFAEELGSEGTISLNGVALTSGYVVAGKTVTINGLEAEKSYRVDFVGTTDAAGNVANPIGLNFTVAKADVDSSKPTVSTAVSGTKITFDFSEELVKQDLNADTTAAEYAKVTVGSTTYYLTDAEIKDTTDKTKFTLDAATALGTANFINTSVKVESFKDAGNNVGDAFTFSTTLAKDTAKPTFGSSSTKLLVADDKASALDVDAIYLTFNEPVKVASGTLTKTVQNGIAYTTGNTTTVADTSGTGVDVDGNGKIEGSELNTVKLSVDLDANSTYTFELAAGLVTDLAGNAITDALTFNVSTGTFTPAPGTVTDSVKFATVNPVVAGATNNVFTLEYAVDVTSSATNAANYTLGGQALPSGTQLQFVDGTKKVRFTLPVGSITANGSYVLEAKNVVDTAGNTLNGGKQSTLVALKESIAPTATKVTVVDSKTFTVDFSEAIANEAAPAGLVVKIAGNTVTPATAVVSGGKLTVTTTADFALTDSISVELKSTNLVDANGNKVKDGVVSK